MSTFMGMPEEYIGDGIYASYDGYSFWLRTPRSDGDHFICLDPIVYADFVKYTTRTLSQSNNPYAPPAQDP